MQKTTARWSSSTTATAVIGQRGNRRTGLWKYFVHFHCDKLRHRGNKISGFIGVRAKPCLLLIDFEAYSNSWFLISCYWSLSVITLYTVYVPSDHCSCFCRVGSAVFFSPVHMLEHLFLCMFQILQLIRFVYTLYQFEKLIDFFV